MEKKLTEMVKGFSKKAKKEAIDHLYNALTVEGLSVSVLNEKYIVVEEVTFSLVASKGSLVAKAW